MANNGDLSWIKAHEIRTDGVHGDRLQAECYHTAWNGVGIQGTCRLASHDAIDQTIVAFPIAYMRLPE